MAKSWGSLIAKWQKRILRDPGWKIRIDEDVEIEEPATAIVVTDRFVYREAAIKLRPKLPPDNRIACHEVCHIAVAALCWSARNAVEETADTVETQLLVEAWLLQSEEVTAELLTRAFLVAYGED